MFLGHGHVLNRGVCYGLIDFCDYCAGYTMTTQHAHASKAWNLLLEEKLHQQFPMPKKHAHAN